MRTQVSHLFVFLFISLFAECSDSSRTPLPAGSTPVTSSPATTTFTGTIGTTAAAALSVDSKPRALTQESSLTLSTTKVRAHGTDGTVWTTSVDEATGAFSLTVAASVTTAYAIVFSDDDFTTKVFTLAFPVTGTVGDALTGADQLGQVLIPSTAGTLVTLGAIETGTMGSASVFRPTRNPLDFFDTDGDGVVDSVDTDDDGDGIADSSETNPLDSDGDGVLAKYDSNETVSNDTDGDGIADSVDRDDTNDGTIDGSADVTFLGSVLAISGTDYTSGGNVALLDTVVTSRTQTSRSFSDNVELTSSDVVLARGSNYVYAINRYGYNNIQVLDPSAGFRTKRQISVGSISGESAQNTNPYDVVEISSSLIYVCLYGATTHHVVAVNTETGAIASFVDLSVVTNNSDQGIDRVSPIAMKIVGSRVYVLCQNFASDFSAVGLGVIACIDTATNDLVDLDSSAAGIQGITLTRKNAQAMVYDSAGDRLLVGSVGGKLFGDEFDQNLATGLDSAIESVYLATPTATPTILWDNGFDDSTPDFASRTIDVGTNSESYEYLSGMTLSSAGKLYVTIDVGFPNARAIELVLANPDAGATTIVTGSLAASIAADSQGFVYVGDRDSSNPRIRIFDSLASYSERGTGIVTLTPPTSLAIFDGVSK
ncbi:MAG: hypothetical protein NUW37_07280 [Planctomycetes bacterium]|nr:hypothetical protein [Planctomycetota bacterium]